MKKIDTEINKKNINQPSDLKIFMFFSKKSSTQFGHKVAYVVDDKSGRKKKVKYTATSCDERATEYKWPDKELIWSGKSSEWQFIGTEKPRSFTQQVTIPRN